ncbi:YbaB/EbfC family nucleoid-associated protein [Candidatus Saccharibacteria bacterium]|jgi:DNA-binding YbaB/EbfC family protein|nr:YbaB/EbfC family nucleoid-associated protein [Candidatus Saccharibacteria bacterium]
MAFDQMKMLNDLRKAQKELKKQQIIAAAGGEDDDPAVEVTINGELKVENISINPEYVDVDDIEELEGWLEAAIRDGMTKAQEVAAEKMKPLMGGMNLPGM